MLARSEGSSEDIKLGKTVPHWLRTRPLVGGRPLVANVLEPVGSAVFPVQPCLAIGEAALDAATALWRVRAVEEWNVLVSDVLEPAYWLAMY